MNFTQFHSHRPLYSLIERNLFLLKDLVLALLSLWDLLSPSHYSHLTQEGFPWLPQLNFLVLPSLKHTLFHWSNCLHRLFWLSRMMISTFYSLWCISNTRVETSSEQETHLRSWLYPQLLAQWPEHWVGSINDRCWLIFPVVFNFGI